MFNRNRPQIIIFIFLFFFFVGTLIYAYGFNASFGISKKFSHKGNPYATEMLYKDNEQRAIYEKQWFPTQTGQVIFFVMDSLPYFYMVNEKEQLEKVELKKEGKVEDSNLLKPSRNVKFIEFLDRLEEQPNNTVLLRSYSHPPTYTLLRMKAMLQGIIPSYDQTLFNLGSQEMIFDSLVYQAKENNPFTNTKREKVLCYAGESWGWLYKDYFDREYLESEENVTNKIEIDLAQYNRVEKEQMLNDDWSSIFLHLYGVDDASHLSDTENTHVINTVIQESNLVKQVLNNVRTSTINTDQTIIMLSDHGVNFNVTGHHGGYTYEETNSFIFGYSKNEFITKDKRDFGQNMDREFLMTPQVFQINVTPTYCMLLGIPIPSDNLGMISPDFFIDKPEIDDFVVANNFFTNFRQVEDAYQFNVDQPLNSGVGGANISKIQNLAAKIKQKYKDLFEEKAEKELSVNSEKLKEFVSLCQQFSVDVINSVQSDYQDPKLGYLWLVFILHSFLGILILQVLIVLKIISIDTEPYIVGTQLLLSSLVSKATFFVIFLISLSSILILLVKLVGLPLFIKIIGTVTLAGIFTLCVFKLRVLIHACKLSFEVIVKHTHLETVLDTLMFIGSVTFYLMTRTSNDYFLYSTVYYGKYFWYACIFMIILSCIKKFKGEVTNFNLFKILIQIAAIHILLRICNYYNIHASFSQPPYFYDEFIKMPFLKHYLPLIVYIVFFGTILIKMPQFLSSLENQRPKFILYSLHILQLSSVAAYYLNQWNIINVSNYVMIFPATAFFTTIIIEVVKQIAFSLNHFSHISPVFKLVYFLINTAAGCGCILEFNSLIQLPAYLLIIYLICSMMVSLKSMSFVSITSMLFFLSHFFFYLSGHDEQFEDLHTNTYSLGVAFELFNIIPIFNGLINTLYYFIVTPTVILLYLYIMKFRTEDLSEGINKFLFSYDLKNFNILSLPQFNEEDNLSESYTQENEINSLKSTKSSASSRNIHKGFTELSRSTFYYLAFLSHSLIAIIGADIRNILKPFDTYKERLYVPIYTFQMIFITTYSLGIAYIIYYYQRSSKQKRGQSLRYQNI